MGKLKRILIIDDNEVTTLYRKKMLSNLYPEMEVRIAENGKIGIDLFKESNDELRLIFLDLSMPVMNGFEFLEALNAYLQAENKEFVKVVISTSNDNDLEKKRAKSLYPNISFYPKPLSKEMIIEIVEGLENA